MERFENLFDHMLLLFFALFGGATRFCLRPPEKKTPGATLSSMIVAAFAGLLVMNGLLYYGWPLPLVGMGAGLGGLLGHDLLTGILLLGKQLREDPAAILRLFRRKGGPHDL